MMYNMRSGTREINYFLGYDLLYQYNA